MQQLPELIQRLGSCGMTLPVIRQFLPCAIDGRSEFESCEELTGILRRHINVVDNRMAALAKSRTLLSELLSRIDTRVG